MDTDPDDYEGSLSTVTDEEWRTAHLRLFDEVVEQGGAVDDHFRFRWAPGEPVEPVEPDDLPGDGWQPGDPDPRFGDRRG